MRLLFVRGVHEEEEVEGSRKGCALFLSTDPQIGTSTMLEAYALRWSIEVYFEEAEQNLGLLKVQTITFVSHDASIHLCAIRYLMLMNGKLNGPVASLGELRGNIHDQLNSMCFAVSLWHNFRAIVGGTLNSPSKQLACSVSAIIDAIDTRAVEFLVSSLQSDVLTPELEHDGAPTNGSI